MKIETLHSGIQRFIEQSSKVSSMFTDELCKTELVASFKTFPDISLIFFKWNHTLSMAFQLYLHDLFQGGYERAAAEADSDTPLMLREECLLKLLGHCSLVNARTML